jgi:biotin carboxyl carrier protein
MTLEIEIAGRRYRVAIEPRRPGGAEAGFTVRLDDEAHAVDVRATDIGFVLAYADTGRSVDVGVADPRDGVWHIELPHVTVAGRVNGRTARSGGGGAAAGPGDQRVVAPMPGRVVRVLVKPGDEVAARQGLVVVEAMKMENELASPKAGRVREVAVAEGASVEAGRLLVVVE